MLTMKKSEMSIALIVAAVIGLIILVVVLVIFGKGSGDASRALGSCEARGGQCIGDAATCDGTVIPNVKCSIAMPKCCLTSIK